MKADFDTIAALFGFVLNGAGLAALVGLFRRQEVETLLGELRSAIAVDLGPDRADPRYVRKKLDALQRHLFSFWMLLLHLLNLGILVLLVVVLFIGPEEVFSRNEGALAEALTPTEQVVYWLWFALSLISYLVSGVSPTLEWLRLWRDARAWIRHATARPGKRR